MGNAEKLIFGLFLNLTGSLHELCFNLFLDFLRFLRHHLFESRFRDIYARNLAFGHIILQFNQQDLYLIFTSRSGLRVLPLVHRLSVDLVHDTYDGLLGLVLDLWTHALGQNTCLPLVLFYHFTFQNFQLLCCSSYKGLQIASFLINWIL